VRLAQENSAIYLDLANDSRQAVEITPEGWKIVENPPVYFRRIAGMKSLPKPEPGGSIRDLKRFINVDSDEPWILIVTFLMGALNPKGPFPILLLQGEQGSAKSTTARILKNLIDPSSSPLKSLPKSEKDFIISARNNWLIVYDNISGMSRETSDMLCRLSTGGGLSTRALYTNDEEKIFEVQRPAILNGIENMINRADLTDRSLLVNLPRIPDEKRKLESDLWFEFDQAKAKILGALLDAVSHAMANLDKVELKSLPRMADFARWIIAGEKKLPWQPGKFSEVYETNRNESMLEVFECVFR
jgi:hypothetical protein